ncbi:MAG: hypothetical protein J0M26_26790 [Planctomycetes bacterium]|nr:hypothetical protein [Planctomycetota bacterium]
MFYYVDNEWIATELCKLFESEFGQFCENNFSHVVVDGNDTTQLVRLYASVDELSVYHDPDPGTYDPKPTQELLQRASYYFRAIQWESLLESLRGQKSRSTQTDGSKQGSTNPANEQDILAFERVRVLLEKHRLMFLYFAVPKQINPLVTGNKWQQDSLTQDQFPKFKSEEIDDNGEFLLTYRRRLEQFVQSCYRKFGSGAGNKPRMLAEDGNVVDVEGGTLPAWYLDDGACVYLDESAEQILASMRDCIRKGHSKLLQPFATAIKESLHDQGKSKWYASEPVRWEFVSRLDSILHELRICELEQLETNKVVDSVEPQCTSQSEKPTSPDATVEDATMGIPDEDDRNSSLILLMLFAQAYYKMLESATSISDWVTAMDLKLNSSYIWTVQNLTNLLSNSKHLSDFPEKFEPLFEDLYPTTIIDVDWPMMVAPHADGFLSAVQRYVLKKGTKEPEENSPAWNMVQLFRPGVETAIKRAENYNRRLHKARQEMFDSPATTQASATSSEDFTSSQDVEKPSGNHTTALHFGFASLADRKWSELTIRFINSETVSVKMLDKTAKLTYSDIGMIDGRSRGPTKQWYLLEAFAKSRGELTWTSPSASRENRKRRKLLSDNLKNFFGIQGEPIVLTEDKKGWRTVFNVSES